MAHFSTKLVKKLYKTCLKLVQNLSKSCAKLVRNWLIFSRSMLT